MLGEVGATIFSDRSSILLISTNMIFEGSREAAFFMFTQNKGSRYCAGALVYYEILASQARKGAESVRFRVRA